MDQLQHGRQVRASRTEPNACALLMPRTAHELYIWPFQDAIHAGCVSVMCSYNGLNGTYACADPTSLGKWLHEELNFQGWVLSDFGSVYEGTEVDAALSGLDSVIGFTTQPFGRDGPQFSASTS